MWSTDIGSPLNTRRGVALANRYATKQFNSWPCDVDVKGTLGWLQGDVSPFVSEASSVSQPRAAPIWDAKLWPGDRRLDVSETPGKCLRVLKELLEEGDQFAASAVKEEQGKVWRLSTTVFVDYVGIGLEAAVFTPQPDTTLSAVGAGWGTANARAVVILKHASRTDVVRFARLAAALSAALRARGLEVTPAGASGDRVETVPLDGGFDLADDDFFADDLSSDDGSDAEGEGRGFDWEAAVEAALGTLFAAQQTQSRTSAAQREEAAQALAVWAERRPNCRPTLALALASEQRRSQVARLLREAPLPERYPVAAALRHCCCGLAATRGAEAAGAASSLKMLLRGLKELPSPAAQELSRATDALAEVHGQV